MHKPLKSEAKVLRRYEPDRALDAISRASAWSRGDAKGLAEALATENLNYQAVLRDYQLAFVAKLVLYFYDKPRLTTRKFDWKDLVEACRILTKHQDPNSYPIRSPQDSARFMIRVAYQQFPDFYGEKDTLARTRLLFRSCAKTVESKTPFDIDGAYKEATGLTLDQSWDLTLALFGLLLTKHGGIQPGPLKAGDLKQNISDPDIGRFLDLVSLTPQEFQNKLRLLEYQLDPFETFNPNPLVNWPMITLPNNRWVVPIVPYLFRRGTEQMFYDVIGYAGREFSGFFGYVFQEYTDRILGILGSSYEIIPERRYFRDGQPHDTCDIIIIKDGDAILLECKTKRLGLRTKFTADEELFRNDLTDVGKTDDKGNVVHAIRQLYRTDRDIRANCVGLQDLHRKVTGAVYPLVLVLDPYYFANAPYIRRIITEELNKGDLPVTHFSWQILDARGLESLCALARQEDLLDLVARKFSSAELEAQEMKTFVDNYVQEKQIDKNTLMHPVLSEEFTAFSEDIESRYGVNFKR